MYNTTSTTLAPSSVVGQSTRDAWINPVLVLAVLFVVGGDLVSNALAQLVGPRVVPITFSCGWAAYSFAALSSVLTDARLLPAPGHRTKLANIQSGVWRDNGSWVLNRLLRDLEAPFIAGSGLAVSVYRVSGDLGSLSSRRLFTGFIVIGVQLLTAAVPFVLCDDLSILVVTAIGIALALLTGALPQWRLEKYSGRRSKGKAITLTDGNGSNGALILINSAGSLDLEDLAASRLLYAADSTMLFGLPIGLRMTQLACCTLTLSWLMLLVAILRLQRHAWYLVLICALGTLWNAAVASSQQIRSPHIEKVEIIHGRKVMQTLMDVELAYPCAGKILRDEYFNPTTLRADEVKWWDAVDHGNVDKCVPTADARREYRQIMKL